MTTQTLTDASTQASPTPFVQPLLVQLGFLRQVLHTNLKGLTHEESLRSPEPGGNCLNWVVGHIVNSRQTWITSLLGGAPLFDDDTITRYRRGSEPLEDGTLAMRLEELIAAYDRSQEPLLAGMARLTPERLGQPAPFSPAKNPNETVGSLVATLCFHEGYHIGQTAILRRLAGHPGAIA